MNVSGPSLPNGFHSRPVAFDDLQRCVELFNAHHQATIDARPATAARIASRWRTPGFDLGESARIVEHARIGNAGCPVGYVEVRDYQTPPVRVGVSGCVHPEYEGQGIGTYLLGWAERRAQRAVARCPRGARVVLHNDCPTTQTRAGELFESRGLQIVRHFLLMEKRFDSRPAVSRWPTGLQVRAYRHDRDLADVCRATQEAFRDHWGCVEESEDAMIERWRHVIETDAQFDPELWFLAVDEGEIAGVCLCRLASEETPELGYVGCLGVRRPWRRLGLGFALLKHAFRQLHDRGKAGACLGVDAENPTGATRLYESAGMRVARSEAVYEKLLRTGRDLAQPALV